MPTEDVSPGVERANVASTERERGPGSLQAEICGKVIGGVGDCGLGGGGGRVLRDPGDDFGIYQLHEFT